MGKELHAAVVIGVDPMTMFSCQVQLERCDQRLVCRRRLARLAGRARQGGHQRPEGPRPRRDRDRVHRRHEDPESGRPARRIHRLLHGGLAQACRPDHRDHASQGRHLPGTADRQADHREPRPEADPVRGFGPAPAPGAVSHDQRHLDQQLGRRAGLCRDRDEASATRRSPPRDSRRHGLQHPSQVGDRGRSRHRHSQLGRRRMGTVVPREAERGRLRGQPDGDGAVGSLHGRRLFVVGWNRRDDAVWCRVSRSLGSSRLEEFDLPEIASRKKS